MCRSVSPQQNKRKAHGILHSAGCFFCAKQSLPHPQAYYPSREEASRSFRERAKPLADRTRELWQSIRRTRDPVTRTLKELAYEQLFRPIWEDAVNDQFYREHPHLRPDPEAENRKVQERLAQVPPVLLQAAYEMVRGQAWNGAEQQWFGDMAITPTVSQQGEQTPVALDEGEMKKPHECTVHHSLYGGNPTEFEKDNQPASKNVEPFQTSPPQAPESFEKRRKSGIISTDKQFGTKIGKHAIDYSLDPSKPEDRKQMWFIIEDIYSTADEVASGEWRGQSKPVKFYIKGDDVVVTTENDEFITILKGGISNARVKNARGK